MHAETMATVDTPSVLSHREVRLRSAATTCLAGLALIQTIELPSLAAQGRGLVALSLAAMAVCVGLGWTLAAAPEEAGERLWRVIAAVAVVALAGWAVPRAVAVPALDGTQGAWTSM